jgi:L,D-transpeptidase YbiS
MTTRRCVRVHLDDQRLELLVDGEVVACWPVSTSARGAGEGQGSERTPRGRHEIRARIGDGQPAGAVFEGRRPTGEVCTPDLVEAEPGRDWILTRILWLRGLEPGRNRGGDVDSMRRWIYIHGTPDESALGTPASHGCIRMKNADVIELFDRVEPGDLVEIVE